MARIKPVARAGAGPEVRQMWGDIEETLGRVPNFIATVAHSPAVVRWLVPFVATLHREGTGSVLDARTKNLVILKTSLVNGCEYCVGHNKVMGASLGVDEQKVEAMDADSYLESPLFDDRDKAVLWWADEVTRNTARYNGKCFANLQNYFDDAEIVELTLLSGMFNMVNRFNDSLHVELEGHESRNGIVKTRHLPESRVTAFARNRVDYAENRADALADADSK
jgi:uncharacterized peroxidase-related enzyme